MRILVLNGPNINFLGIREPEIYGKETYQDLIRETEKAAAELSETAAGPEGAVRLDFFQSNHEGALVDAIQAAYRKYDGIVINPAAYTHTSIAIADALKAVGIPTVEVHISDVGRREDFRQVSYVRPVCLATVSGEGIPGYAHALRILADHFRTRA